MTTHTLNSTELLRWWHQHQAQQFNHEADLIRNGLLQDVFALRRHLEIACQTQPNDQDFNCQERLAELGRIYTTLEHLGNRLGAPYQKDSLPLALQFAIQPWQTKSQWQVNLPSTWEPEPVEQTRLLVMLLETSLQSLTTEGQGPEQCHLSLGASPDLAGDNLAGDLNDLKEFRFQIDSATPLPGPLVESLAALLFPILETFKLFTQGTYEQNFQPQSLTWRLCWPSSPPSTPLSC